MIMWKYLPRKAVQPHSSHSRKLCWDVSQTLDSLVGLVRNNRVDVRRKMHIKFHCPHPIDGQVWMMTVASILTPT